MHDEASGSGRTHGTNVRQDRGSKPCGFGPFDIEFLIEAGMLHLKVPVSVLPV
jgi:hypothetical protein